MTFPQPSESEHQQAIQAAIAQFKAWASDPKTIAVDTETTGLNGPAWEFAAVRSGQLVPVLAFTCAVPADTEWSAVALEMHRSRLPEIAVATQPINLTPALVDLMLQNRAVSYGADFDRGAMERTWQASFTIGCAQEAYAPLAGRWSESRGVWKWVKLEEACQMEGIDTAPFLKHSALGDAQLLALLIQAVAQRTEGESA